MEGVVEVLKRCWEVRGWEDWDVTLGWMACPSLVDSVDSLWAQKTYGGAVRSEWVVRKWGQRTSPSFKMFGLWGIVKRTGVAGGEVGFKSILLCFAFMILNGNGRDTGQWKKQKMGAGEWSIQWGPWGSCAQKAGLTLSTSHGRDREHQCGWNEVHGLVAVSWGVLYCLFFFSL